MQMWGLLYFQESRMLGARTAQDASAGERGRCDCQALEEATLLTLQLLCVMTVHSILRAGCGLVALLTLFLSIPSPVAASA